MYTNSMIPFEYFTYRRFGGQLKLRMWADLISHGVTWEELRNDQAIK